MEPPMDWGVKDDDGYDDDKDDFDEDGDMMMSFTSMPQEPQ